MYEFDPVRAAERILVESRVHAMKTKHEKPAQTQEKKRRAMLVGIMSINSQARTVRLTNRMNGMEGTYTASDMVIGTMLRMARPEATYQVVLEETHVVAFGA